VSARCHFVEEIRHRAHIVSDRLLRSFAAVPRESFLNEGPWRLRSDLEPNYWTTESADPAHLYHDVLVALDESRGLDNGLPSLWAYLFNAIAIQEGEHVVHVGCGTGYYSAILSEMVGPSGRITAIECDTELAKKATGNLRGKGNVDVIRCDGCRHEAGAAQVIVVNAGVTNPAPLWLDSLVTNGRLLLPLTIDGRQGAVLLVKRLPIGYEARALRGIEIFPCIGGRSLETEALLRVAFWKQNVSCVRSLRRDAHEADESCWLHGDSFCLSKRALHAVA
jgi:protein-L-isoaspartate(D-aspartate) O-methyltransferase